MCSRWTILIILGIFPLTARAQQTNPTQTLNETQKLGKRVFQQRCGICHDQARPGFIMYGPSLYKDLVNGSEDAIKEMIRSGSSKMPGFRFGLQPAEIDAIVEYLKTVPKPQRNTGPATGDTTDPID